VVRVIQNENEDFRDQIIRATNNQNKMAAEALISTSRLHKQLDAYFAENGLFYDRRKGHYKDQGKEISLVVSIITLVQAVVTIVLGKPNDARGRPRDYVTKDEKRRQVFGSDDYDKGTTGSKKDPYELAVYLGCIKILRRVDEFIESPLQRLDPVEQRNLRFYLARYVACQLTGSAYFATGLLLRAMNRAISDDELKAALKVVRRVYRKNGGDDDAAKGKDMSADLDEILKKKFSPPNKTAKMRNKPPKANMPQP
jgi:hypothetical protein